MRRAERQEESGKKRKRRGGEGRGEQIGPGGDEGATRRADLWEQVIAKAHM